MEASTTTLIFLLLLAMSTSNVSNDDVNKKVMETITDNNIGEWSYWKYDCKWIVDTSMNNLKMKLSIGRGECPVHVFINGPVQHSLHSFSLFISFRSGTEWVEVVIEFIKSSGSAAQFFLWVWTLCVGSKWIVKGVSYYQISRKGTILVVLFRHTHFRYQMRLCCAGATISVLASLSWYGRCPILATD